ncbi:odorant receptor 4-like isoform X1 [Frieseomelitta varia]|uniref:odorant receptor 4-like isoform X1 n=1 Tax=Frieseomelitta varia TaxID=561572 RepID=UPI001CB699C5|nr:odorant receptor 4-like isoform X1 [Frieseomelitta varia]
MRLLYPLLKIIGAWPDPAVTTVSSTIIKWCTISISYFLQLLLLIPSFMYIFGKETNSRKQVKLLMPHINGLSQLIKYTILLRRMKEFRETMEDIRNDWLSATDENRQIFRENAKVGYKVVLGIAIIMYTGGMCNRTVMPLSKGRIVLPNNATIRLLSSQSYFVFFDAQRTPNYEIIFALQVLGGFVIYTILCGTMGVSSLLCMHMCSLLRILANMMSELSEQLDVSENAVQKKIASIVEYRTKIKKFLNNVEEITPYICCFEIINDTLITCAIGYCIIMEWESSNTAALIVYISLQMSTIFINFTMCYIGQLLINESEHISRTSATLNWYRFSSKKARCLIPVIIISNYRIKITAAKILEVSLATFTDIMKASMGYLNVLRSAL